MNESQRMTETEFSEACSQIDVQAVANQIFSWLIENLNDYVDNSDTAYMIYFSGKTLDQLPLMKAMKDVYDKMLEGLEDEATQKAEENCINEFEKVMAAVSELLKDQEKLKVLFEKLITFYDTKLISNGKTIAPYIEQLDGYIDMEGLMFEPFSVDLKVKRKEVRVDKNGNQVGKARAKVIKKMTIDPGFCVQFELIFWRPASETTSSFSLM